MTSKDAWMFPLVGSTFLFGLYLLFRVFSKEYINLLLSSYFIFFGLGATAKTIYPWLELILPAPKKKKKTFTLRIPFMKETKFTITPANVASVIIAVLVGIWYLFTKHWVANNILGFAFSVQAITMLSLSSFKIASILLIGLFFYDIFWVFGTDVMVTVAKSFDAPVKLLFPRNILTGEEFQFAMIGLGDIVIPGLLIALLLRFDARHTKRNKRTHFEKYYFYSTFFGYIVGLVTTMLVMHIFKAAQPALLYLVPSCLLSGIFTALLRGEIGQLLDYSEEPLEALTNTKNNDTAETSTTDNSNNNNNNNTKNAENKEGKTKKAKNNKVQSGTSELKSTSGNKKNNQKSKNTSNSTENQKQQNEKKKQNNNNISGAKQVPKKNATKKQR